MWKSHQNEQHSAPKDTFKCERIEIMQNILVDINGIELGINNRKS
jgi:hypothetical protein